MEKAIIARKKELISAALTQLKNTRYLQKINKETFYYAETVKNYKSLLTKPEKREEFIKQTLSRIPAFKKFMNDNSQWGSMFGSPGSTSPAQNLPGLQTRASLNSILQERMGSNGPNSLQNFQHALQKGQAELASVKNKLLGAAKPQEIEGLPNFKPNNQKSKTFFQRLEYGVNIQFEKSKTLYPATANVGLSIGYKLSDKFSTGVGLSGVLGMGTGWDKVKITGEGIGIRSYLDWKFKKNLFVSSGFEQNFTQRIHSLNNLTTSDPWNQSALIGLTKRVKTLKQKGGKIQVLFDVFAHRQIPAGNPIKVRTGFDLK